LKKVESYHVGIPDELRGFINPRLRIMELRGLFILVMRVYGRKLKSAYLCGVSSLEETSTSV
jgi:hypothetical protein